MFTPDSQPIRRETWGRPCVLCGETPPLQLSILFPELEGQPRICSRCVYTKLTGLEAPEWSIYT